jgi:hypothetical protein
VSRFWFTYCDLSGRLLGVLITDSPNVLQARNRAAIAGTDMGAPYCEGYELDCAGADLIPTETIGRMLDPEEVRMLVRDIESRMIPKRPASASAVRHGSIRTRAKR